MVRDKRGLTLCRIMAFGLLLSSLICGIAAAAGKKVFVVMSYHEGYAWQQEIREGIESVLKDQEIKYFSLDTKRDLAGGEDRAKEAFSLYQKFQPDLVLAADDNAQSLFVVPYLKEKVKTPVVFCGVNDEAAKYGYPASNVTGVIEKTHWREGLYFLHQIVPSIKKVAVVYNDTPSNRILVDQIQREKSEYPVEIAGFAEVNTVEQLGDAVRRLAKKADALVITLLEGLKDQNGAPMDARVVNPMVAEMTRIPTLGPATWQVKTGLLASVAKTGQEQGSLAAEMALEILEGKAVKDMPVTHNRNGLRIVNMTTAHRLGITLTPESVMGTEIVLTEAPPKKVLIVLSYHQNDTWQREIMKGIESVLSGLTLKTFYMDTKNNWNGAEAKAKEAFSLYQEFQPDAVIAADDNAQSLFVVPYLKDKVKTPVVFCGVNYDASKYGYPASNVTGIVEKIHFRESISFMQLIHPPVEKIAVIYRDTTSNRLNIKQLKEERDTYSAEIVDIFNADSIIEYLMAMDSLHKKADAFILLNLTGIHDAQGNPMEGVEAAKAITNRSRYPVIAVNSWSMQAGPLCGVVLTGQEQGALAADMVKDILSGRPVRDIPVGQNRNGERMINVTTAKRLGIYVSPEALRGTVLVR